MVADGNVGFSPAETETWRPVNPNYREDINVKEQGHNPNSLLNYYKRLLQVRKTTPALIEGEYVPLHNAAKNHLTFLRVSSNQTVLVILNFSASRLDLDFSRTKEIKESDLRILFSSAERSTKIKSPRELEVGHFDAFIAEVQTK